MKPLEDGKLYITLYTMVKLYTMEDESYDLPGSQKSIRILTPVINDSCDKETTNYESYLNH